MSRTPVMVVGASGFLGQKLLSRAPTGVRAVGTYASRPIPGLRELDVAEPRAVTNLFDEIRPEAVIYAAAYMDCDRCERHPRTAARLNAHGVRNVAAACRATGARLLYVSSSYVFDGRHGMYDESSAPSPINVLGRTKVQGEAEAMKVADWTVVRFSISYGFNGPRLANGFLDEILSGRRLTVDDVSRRQPPLIDDVADCLFLLLQESADGIFHLGGPEIMTKYALAQRLERDLVDRSVSAITPSSSPATTAPRPRDVTLDCGAIHRLGFRFVPLETGVERIREQLRCPDVARASGLP